MKQILVVSLDLCERNSGSASEHGSQFWFNVLDRLVNAKGFLRLAKEMPEHGAVMSGVLSELLRMTMQRMVSKVPLPDLLRKITVDHAGNRLGEFREMIGTMLRTYGSELDVCAGAGEAMRMDVRSMAQKKRRLKVQGSRMQRIMGHRLGQGKSSRGKFPHRIAPTSVLTVNNEGDGRITGFSVKASQVDQAGDGACAALSRLRAKRSRRLANNGDSFAAEGRLPPDPTMMTMADRYFSTEGSLSDAAYFEPRLVGALSGAEHYGRLG